MSGKSEREAYYRSLEMVQTRKQLARTEAAFNELDQLYGDLMDSGAFLYAVVTPDGAILAMNMGMKVFLGRDTPDTLFEFCLFSQMEALKGLLQDALTSPVAALVPLVRGNGTQVWIEAEFAPTVMEGIAAVQVTGADVSEWMKTQANAKPEDEKTELDSSSGSKETADEPKVPAKITRHDNKWPQVLDSCPGLLCCVLDHAGRILYVSQGYRAVAKRLMGHDCDTGVYYPPQRTENDQALHSLLSAAMLGGTDGLEITEHRKDPDNPDISREILWSFTAAPLRIENVISGVVLYVQPVPGVEPDSTKPAPKEPETITNSTSNTNILDALAVRAVVVNSQGLCLAATPLFIQSCNLNTLDTTDIKNKKLLDLIPQDTANEAFHRDFPQVLTSMTSITGTSSQDQKPETVTKLDCRLANNFGELVWLDVQARPITWDGENAVLLTCTDVTELRRTREQLKRALEIDRTTGILNRQGMERLLTHEVERVIRETRENTSSRNLSLIILDIDGFRRINAEQGYAAAGRALKALTSAMHSVLSEFRTSSNDMLTDGVLPDGSGDAASEFNGDTIGRWGGDEFMVLTHRSGPDACSLADSLRDLAQKDSELSMTLSVGVAEFRPDSEMDIAGFVAAAFDAMIAAKHGGGNQTVLANIKACNPVPILPEQDSQVAKMTVVPMLGSGNNGVDKNIQPEVE